MSIIRCYVIPFLLHEVELVLLVGMIILRVRKRNEINSVIHSIRVLTERQDIEGLLKLHAEVQVKSKAKIKVFDDQPNRQRQMINKGNLMIASHSNSPNIFNSHETVRYSYSRR